MYIVAQKRVKLRAESRAEIVIVLRVVCYIVCIILRAFLPFIFLRFLVDNRVHFSRIFAQIIAQTIPISAQRIEITGHKPQFIVQCINHHSGVISRIRALILSDATFKFSLHDSQV